MGPLDAAFAPGAATAPAASMARTAESSVVAFFITRLLLCWCGLREHGHLASRRQPRHRSICLYWECDARPGWATDHRASVRFGDELEPASSGSRLAAAPDLELSQDRRDVMADRPLREEEALRDLC